MSNHTRGPWLVNPKNAQIDMPGIDAPICQLLWPTIKRSESETRANARLISAAPDLLEALIAAEAFMSIAVPEYKRDRDEAVNEVLPRIRAAIAKATGEPL